MSAAEDTPVSTAEAQALFGAFSEFPALILAVSGGPDSTALLWLAARWRKSLKRSLKAPPKLVAVTVDHGLRPESKVEAAAVAWLSRKLGVTHRTLRWSGRKPGAGLQEAARLARYRLLAEAARTAGARHILTAHTLDDQAETVLFRMARGSGVSGLSGMSSATPLPVAQGRGLLLIRPFLEFAKSRLIATLKAAKVAYADDPSNRDPRFARPRLRNLMPALDREGLTAERLARLAQRVGRVELALHAVVEAAAEEAVPDGWRAGRPVTFAAHAFFVLPGEIALRLLLKAIEAAGDEGPVELGKLETLHAALLQAAPQDRFRRTLAGAMVTMEGGRLTVERAPQRRSRAPKRP